MNKVLQLSLLMTLFLVTNIVTSAQTSDWGKLVMLKSTRDEVEAILGKPGKFFETSGSYTTDLGSFSVWYSDGKCNVDNTNQYRVSPGIVISLQFMPKSTEPLRSYESDLSDFTEWKFDEIPGSIFWIRKDGSVSYETIRSGGQYLVFTIRVYPSEELHKNLACGSKK